MVNSIIKMLDKTAEAYPDRIAVSTASVSVTFKAYKSAAQKIGAALLSEAELFNEPVAVLLPGSEIALFCFMGILYSGNYYVPLDYDSPAERIGKILQQLKNPMVLTDPAGAKKLAGLLPPEKILLAGELPEAAASSELLKPGAVWPWERIIDTDPAYIIFTSGSTGDPKGVIVPHRGVIDILEWWTETFGLNEKTVFANQAPFHFDLSVPDIFTPLFTGGRVHILDKMLFMNPIALVNEINRAGVDSLNWSPSAMMMLSYTKAFKKASFENLRRVMFIGEPMPVKHLNYWRQNNPDTLFVNLYGPTETVYASTYYIVDREFEDHEILPIGKACGNERVFLLSEEGEVVEEKGVTAEICIAGSCLASGYYGKESGAFDVLEGYYSVPERFYHTGDLGRYNTYGELECLGRKDSQIKHMGYRIDLGEIETNAAAVPGIRQACVLYDRKKTEIHLFYEADPGIGRAAILKVLEDRIPKYMLPSKLTRFDHMPLNQNGKTDRAGIAREYL